MPFFLLTKVLMFEMKEPHIPCVTQSFSQMQYMYQNSISYEDRANLGDTMCIP